MQKPDGRLEHLRKLKRILFCQFPIDGKALSLQKVSLESYYMIPYTPEILNILFVYSSLTRRDHLNFAWLHCANKGVTKIIIGSFENLEGEV